MNLKPFIGPDGMVELRMPGEQATIRRWPIDAKQMVAHGAQPVSMRAAPPAAASEPVAGAAAPRPPGVTLKAAPEAKRERGD